MVDSNKFFEIILREYTNARASKVLQKQPELAVTRFDGHNGTSLLHLAASRGNLELAKLLTDAAKSLNRAIHDLRDNDNNAPMHWAAMCGHLPMVRFLHEDGATLSPGNVVGTIPLSDAAGAGRTEVIKYIIRSEGIKQAFVRNLYNLDAYARSVYSLWPDALEIIIDTACKEPLHKAYMHDLLGEGFTARDIAESMRLAYGPDSPAPEIHARLTHVIALLDAVGIDHSPQWKTMSVEEQRHTRTIDHAGRWERFQQQRAQ